jgi:hypothetical protein
LAVVSFGLVLARVFDLLWLTGLGATAELVYMFVNFRSLLSTMAEGAVQAEGDLACGLFQRLMTLAVESVKLEWGWGVLSAGAAFLLVSAGMSDGDTHRRMARPRSAGEADVAFLRDASRKDQAGPTLSDPNLDFLRRGQSEGEPER